MPREMGNPSRVGTRDSCLFAFFLAALCGKSTIKFHV